MSFIDYNFFPILFFLGWNILTTKQFRPNIYNTSNYRTLPGLSVFSLEGPLSTSSLFLMNKKQKHDHIFDESKIKMLKQEPIINSINQKALQAYVNHPKTNHILDFIPEFKFLSENQKLITIPQTNIICSENQTKDRSIFPPGANKFFNNLPLKKFSGGAFYNYSQQIEEGKKEKLKHPILTVYKKEKFIINYIAKPTKWLINEDKTHYFTNHNLINNNWKKDFKSNLFHFTYRPKSKTFLSFFSYSTKIKPIFPIIESSINSASSFYEIQTGPFLNSTHEKEQFFKGLCFSQNNISFWEKIQKPLGCTWFFNKMTDPQTKSFLRLFDLKNQMKNGSILQKRDLKHEAFSTLSKQPPVEHFNWWPRSFLVNTKKECSLDGEITNKAELGLKNNHELKIDDQFLNPTCEKKQLLSVSPRSTRDLNPSKTDNNLNRSFSASSLYLRDSERLDKQNTRPSFNDVLNTNAIKNNDYDHDSSMFKSSFLYIKTNTKRLNRINLIQKRRAKIRLLLRISNQNIYSLNQFQIPLCFSKIFKPAIFFTGSSRFNLASSFSKSVENKDRSIFKTFIFDHFFNAIKRVEWRDNRSFFKTNFENNTNNELKKRPFNTGFMELNNSTFNGAKNESESQNSFSRTPFLQNLESAENSFVKLDQEIDSVDNYKNRRKNWYMKTQFFQHIAWNMKHSLLDHFSNFEYLLRTNDLSVKNNDFVTKSSNQSKKAGLNKYYFSEKPKKTLQGYTICQNYFLNIYAGSWYYENLAFPYSIFNTINKIPLLPLHSESFFNWWQKVFFKQKNVTGKEKLLESKRVAIMWLYAREYNSLQKPYYWLYKNKFESDQAILGGSEHNHKNQTQLFTLPRVEEKRLQWNSLTLSNHHFNNSQALPVVLPQVEPWSETQIYKKNPFFEKSQIRLESDIGIYSLAHKLSSVGFRNGNNSSHIYPWRYNDSYRYNFQNMNLLNQGLKNFLGFSDFKNQNRDPFVFSTKNTNVEQNFTRDKRTHFSNFRKFLDFQNPIFSKIYAPVFQPQDLNLLSFLTNSFLNVMPHSFRETSPRGSFFLPDQIQPIISNYPHFLKNSVGFQNTPKKFKMFSNLYHKLPINGIHSNPYPWITQNAVDRWSTFDPLLDSSLFNRNQDKFSDRNPLVTNFKNNAHSSTLTTSVNMPFPRLSQKQSLKNSNSQLHFTEKASCIKKPSIFFSSFRYLPYFFISETPSAQTEPREKNLVFPQANLSLFSSVNSSNYQLQKPGENLYGDLSIPQYDLFNNNILKENQKKQILQTWKGSLQQKFFSLKPLSTFVKKELGYQTSLFLKAPQVSFKNNKKFFKPIIQKVLSFSDKKMTTQPSLIEDKTRALESYADNYWPNHNSIQKKNLVPIQKNTWKVFPPLFQPLTFRFIDLNLPRTWSSELLTLRSNNSYFNKSQKNQKGTLLKEKPFKSNSVASDILSPLKQREPRAKQQTEPNILHQNQKWNVTQKNFFRFSLPFYFSDFFRFPVTENNQKNTKYTFNNYQNKENTELYEPTFPLTNIAETNEYKQLWNNNQKFEKKNRGSVFNETKFLNSKIIVYGEKPLLKNRTTHGPPLKNQKESISLPNYLKNITNQNYQNLCPNNLNELYSVFWILFNKTLFIYLSLHYLRKFISFLGTEYIRNLFKIFVTMKFIDGNILSIIKTFQDFNFQLNQQNVIDIKVNKQLKEIKRN